MNLQEIRTQVLAMESMLSIREAADTKYVLDNAINNSLREWAGKRKWSWLLTEETFDVTSGMSRLSLPKNFMRFGRIFNSENEALGQRKFDTSKRYGEKIEQNSRKTFAIGPVRQTDFYNAGTVDIGAGATSVNGVGTAWDDTLVGRILVVNQGVSPSWNPFYSSPLIQSVEGPGALTLAEPFNETLSLAKSYKIDPAGTLEIRFKPEIVGADTYTMYYYRLPRKLVNDYDIPYDLPEEFHSFLVWDTRARILHGTEERQVLRQEAIQRSDMLMQQMKGADLTQSPDERKLRVYD